MEYSDFQIEDYIRKGLFYDVLLLKKYRGPDCGTYYAGKRLDKVRLGTSTAVKNFRREIKILEEVRNGPFINKMVCSFADDKEELVVLEFLPVEDLVKISRIREFDEKEIIFYAAEIILGIEYLHSLGIIHRDIKLENIGIDKQGHIAIMDFGVSKKVHSKDIRKRAHTMCGTREYVAPEVTNQPPEGYYQAVDWFSLGISLFRMATTYFPDVPDDLDARFNFPSYMSPKLCDLISQLTRKDPEERLGGGGRGAEEIKNHPFFSETDWTKVMERKTQAPSISWITTKFE